MNATRVARRPRACRRRARCWSTAAPADAGRPASTVSIASPSSFRIERVLRRLPRRAPRRASPTCATAVAASPRFCVAPRADDELHDLVARVGVAVQRAAGTRDGADRRLGTEIDRVAARDRHLARRAVRRDRAGRRVDDLEHDVVERRRREEQRVDAERIGRVEPADVRIVRRCRSRRSSAADEVRRLGQNATVRPSAGERVAAERRRTRCRTCRRRRRPRARSCRSCGRGRRARRCRARTPGASGPAGLLTKSDEASVGREAVRPSRCVKMRPLDLRAVGRDAHALGDAEQPVADEDVGVAVRVLAGREQVAGGRC